jgi:hypothetical protein
MDDIFFRGRFVAQAVNPDGSVAWEEPLAFDNAPTSAGLNDILSVYLGGGTQKTAWFMGLVASAGFSAFAPGDTMASHPGWAELTGYAETARPAWTPGAAAGQAITNPTAAAFTMNGAQTIKGAFLVSDSTKAGTAGTLWATGAFAAAQVLQGGQVLRVNYTCSATGS